MGQGTLLRPAVELSEQLNLDFSSGAPEQGYARWQAERRAARQQLARKMGLPLGQNVEVRLLSGIVLRGRLALRDEMLFVPEKRDFNLEFVVDGVPFTAAEIESCVRQE